MLYSSKNFFSNNYIVDIFVFASSVISLMSTSLIIYLLYKHEQTRMLITSLVLHKIKDVEASSNETNSEFQNFCLHRHISNNTKLDNCYVSTL